MGVQNTDPHRRFWTALTIRVAWELVRMGVRPKGSTLREAREHALWLVPQDAGLAEAEAIAGAAAKDFADRLKGNYRPWRPDPDLHILPSPHWRKAVHAAAEPVHDLVFRLHYADGLSLEEMEQSTRINRSTLRTAREAVRELVRSVTQQDGIHTDDWDIARFDRFIARVASAAGDACPGPWGLGTEGGKAHAESCPRCSRALRLMRGGYLSSTELQPPEDRCLPTNAVDLVCVMISPEARRHQKLISRTFGEHLRAVTEEVFFLNGSQIPDLEERLVALAENNTPPASQMRVVRRSLPGRWGRYAVLGPATDWLQTEVQGMTWGEVAGINPLPEPLPAPPSSAQWWVAAAGVALLAGLLGMWVFRPGYDGQSVMAQRTESGLVFQAAIDAHVDVWALQGMNIVPLFHSRSPADKGVLATGDGRYVVNTPADAYVVITRNSEVPENFPVAGAIAQSNSDRATEGRLKDELSGAEVAVIR